MQKPRIIEVLTIRVTRRRWLEAPPSSRRPFVEETGEAIPHSRPGLAKIAPVLPLRRKAVGA